MTVAECLAYVDSLSMEIDTPTASTLSSSMTAYPSPIITTEESDDYVISRDYPDTTTTSDESTRMRHSSQVGKTSYVTKTDVNESYRTICDEHTFISWDGFILTNDECHAARKILDDELWVPDPRLLIVCLIGSISEVEFPARYNVNAKCD